MSDSTKIVTRVTRLTIMPEGDVMFSERAMHIKIEDEAGGEFVEIEHHIDDPGGKNNTISIDPDEWPVLREAIDRMMKEISDHEKP